MARIRVVSQASGNGLLRDMDIVVDLLEQAGHSVDRTMVRTPGTLARRLARLYSIVRHAIPSSRLRSAMTRAEICLLGLFRRKQYDANIFLENLFPSLMSSASSNLLIPNQEWFRPWQSHYLERINLVLCKTREAERVFTELGCVTAFTSFTSLDKGLADTPKDTTRVLHFAGNGLSKGTQAILRAWSRHPEWPDLWITQRKNTRTPLTGANMHYFDHLLTEADIQRLQNEVAVYVGPSQAEGFGHALVEALSAQALVVTTDGAPMNEVVRPERGFLVPYREVRPQRFGHAYVVDEAALEETLGKVFALAAEERTKIGRNARTWFIDNDRLFRTAFLAAVESVLAKKIAAQPQRSQAGA